MTPVSIAKYKQTFSFDAIGNMRNKVSTTNIPGAQGNSYPKAELDYSLNYEYDPAYAHRLIRAGNRYYRYDANGNITAEKDGPFTDEEEFAFTYSYFENEDVYGTDYGFGLDAPKETEQSNPQDLFAYRRNYTWNERNLLTKSSDRNFTVHYRYGDDGQRALKYTDEGRSETLYFNNFFTIHIPTQDQNNPQGLRVHKHIFVGNSRLVTAMTHTDNQGDNDEQKAKRYYYHSDHLGSAQFVTDWKCRQYEHIEYTPYGELWIEEVAAGLDKLPFRFTGKELDEETGLYYYGARYLDPKYSRWLSGDPALNDYMAGSSVGEGGIYNTVNFNVYHYGGNNPIKYVDPTGMWINNGDGTYTAEKGDTLYGLYGDDWKEKSGFDRDPRTLQPGEVVGKKTENIFNTSNSAISTVQAFFDGAAGACFAFGAPSWTSPYAGIGNSFGLPEYVVTQIPMRTLPDPKFVKWGNTFKDISKKLIVASVVLGIGDSIYTGISKKSFLAAGKRFIRNAASTASGFIAGGLVSIGITALSGGVGTVPGTIAGTVVGTTTSYYVDYKFKGWGW
ncbi:MULTISPECIES: RHS repeat-associated core domain-containing protein [unclassified Treponema]|uniref:RHS repeat-associated core domain-containing protein n=1 Tax=unclassified Treponema TaxID=2638727 RepID=UPI0020A43FB2|nr:MULTISPECIES: RHS repeat-associated core domain-containing protein [unclassified Treponema]